MKTHYLLQFFEFNHLPKDLQRVSEPFAILAEKIRWHCPDNPESTAALRKLLEAKDCAVRSLLFKAGPPYSGISQKTVPDPKLIG